MSTTSLLPPHLYYQPISTFNPYDQFFQTLVCVLTLLVLPGLVPYHLRPLGLVVLGMLGFYWGEAQVQTLHTEWDSLLSSGLLYLPSVAHIVYTNALGTAYRQVALALTEFGEC